MESNKEVKIAIIVGIIMITICLVIFIFYRAEANVETLNLKVYKLYDIEGTEDEHEYRECSATADEIVMLSKEYKRTQNLTENKQVTGKQINGNYRLGNSEYFIIEACEYVESFLKFSPKSEIILNIDKIVNLLYKASSFFTINSKSFIFSPLTEIELLFINSRASLLLETILLLTKKSRIFSFKFTSIVGTPFKELIISSLDNSINLYEQNLKEILSFINSYINYIKENKKRPEFSSELNSKYRFYLPNFTKSTLTSFLSQITAEGLELTFEEKVLLKHQYTDKEAADYIEYIKRKFDNNESSDKLEIKVLNGINKIEYSEKERLKKKLNSTKIEDPKKIEEEIERKIVDNLRECIFKNPEQEIDFNNGIHKISFQNRRDLEKYRYDLLSLILLKRIIELRNI